jgi:hypothetical protein
LLLQKTQKARRDDPGGLYFTINDQQVQHISGMPLQLIIIGMPNIGIIGILAFIGICICMAFIMVLFPEGWRVGQS